MELGKSSSGLYAESNWLKNTDDGTQTGGVGAGYNLEVGPVMLNAGAKAIYLGPKKAITAWRSPSAAALTLR